MQVLVKPHFASAKRESWAGIFMLQGKEKEVSLDLKSSRSPRIRSAFQLISGKFGKLQLPGKGELPGAQLEAMLSIVVSAERQTGLLGKAMGKWHEEIAAELLVKYKILLIGTELEIENARLAWDASEGDRTLPKKDIERAYSLAMGAGIPEELAKGLDPQALLLIELFRGTKVKY